MTPPRAYNLLAALFSVLIVATTFIPYLAQHLSPPPNHTFSWLLTAIPDQCSYLMWMDQHAKGAFLVENRMSTSAAGHLLPNPTWLILGLASRLLGLPLIVTYHAGRAAFSLLCLFLLWRLCLTLLCDPKAAFFAFALASTGSGLAWLELLGLDIPSADWVTELWLYPSILYYPHFALSLALLFGSLLLLESAPSLTRSLFASLLLFLLALVHPYTALTICGLLFTQWLLSRRLNLTSYPQRYLHALAGPAFGLAILCAQALLSPSFRSWTAQNYMPSPPPHSFALGLGLVLPLSILGTLNLARRRAWTEGLILCGLWVPIAFLLAYAYPLIPFGRRLVEGVHAAFAILAAFSIFPLSHSRLLLAISFVLLSSLSNFYLVLRESLLPNPGHIPKDWTTLFEEVKALEGPKTIFSDPRTSMFLQAFAQAKVFIGHKELTDNFDERLATVEQVLSSPDPIQELSSKARLWGCRWAVLPPDLIEPLGPEPIPYIRAKGTTWVLLGPF